MIHAIYIYFIINALIAGGETDRKSFWLMFLFGLPYYIVDITWSWIKPWLSKMEIRTLYQLYFTKKFSDDRWIEILKDIYPQSSNYRKWVIRRIDKKYKYGITSEKPIY